MNKKATVEKFLRWSKEEKAIIEEYIHKQEGKRNTLKYKKVEAWFVSLPKEEKKELEDAFERHWGPDEPTLEEIVWRFGLTEVIRMLKECHAKLDEGFWADECKYFEQKKRMTKDVLAKRLLSK